MEIAIASGKGGTGKTTIAVNLAYVASLSGRTVSYLDCDVEEPNGHIFLKPEIQHTSQVTSPVPEVDPDKCKHCGLCQDICQYNAIVCIKDYVLVFQELCHSCGGCLLLCPNQAVSEVPKEIGVLETGTAGGLSFAQGILNIAQAKSPPVIRAVKSHRNGAQLRIVDAPPGTSCPVIESVRGSDFVILVAEPTPFGLHDLKLAVEVVRKLELPFGVVINRAVSGCREVNDYCDEQAIDILAEIPDDRAVAESYSRGELICRHVDGYETIFVRLLENVTGRVGIGTFTGKEMKNSRYDINTWK